MKTLNNKVIGLVRVSTEQQAADDRAGLPRQHQEIKRIVAAYNLELTETIEFTGVSGTLTHEMPVLQQALRRVRERSIAGIVLADLDRLFRLKEPGGFAILNDFQSAGATIWTGTGVLDFSTESGSMMSMFLGIVSGMELRAIKRRMEGGREAKRRRGELAGSKILLSRGIDYDHQTQKWGTTAEIHTVQEAYRLVDEEGVCNLMTISRRLGVNRATLKLWLKNPIYMGIRRFDTKRGEDFQTPRRGSIQLPGKRRDRRKVPRAKEDIFECKVLEYPPVTIERWNRVQEKLAATRKRRDQRLSGKVTVNLGRGLLVCGHCQGTIYANSGINRKYPNRQGYYYCRRNHYLAKQAGESCPQPNLRKSDVDAMLSTFVADHLTKPDTLRTILASSQNDREPVHNSKALLADLEKQKNRLLDALQHGRITDHTNLAERLSRIEEEKQKILSVSEDAALRRKQSAQTEEFLRRVIQGAFAFARLASVEERKTLLDGLLSGVTLKGTAITAFKPQPGIFLSADVCANRSRVGMGSSRRRA